MDRRREAFLAAEHARRLDEAQSGPRTDLGASTIFIREKSLGTAYLLWFFAGMIGAHRFYLGLATTGAAQAGLWVISWAVILGGSFLEGTIGLVAAIMWVLIDAILIPSLQRQVNHNARRSATSRAFA